jgi:hypothetical protein
VAVPGSIWGAAFVAGLNYGAWLEALTSDGDSIAAHSPSSAIMNLMSFGPSRVDEMLVHRFAGCALIREIGALHATYFSALLIVDIVNI